MSSAKPPPKRLPTVVEETWLSNRLDALDLFSGITNGAERAERVRARIVALDCADALAGKRTDGTTETYRELFARLYGEPL